MAQVLIVLSDKDSGNLNVKTIFDPPIEEWRERTFAQETGESILRLLERVSTPSKKEGT